MNDLDRMITIRRSLQHQIYELDNIILPRLVLWQSKALSGYKLEAIKQLRDEQKLSLKEAKEMVDSFIASNSMES